MAAVVLAAPALSPVQVPSPVPLPSPKSAPGTASGRAGPPASIEAEYGPAQPEELERVANDGNLYQRHNVIVRGALTDLAPGRYLLLSAGAARVMLIPLDPGDYGDYKSLPGTDVEVTGIVRVLPRKQELVPCLGQLLPESKCQDPLLPELPNAHPSWPKVSITMLKAVDRDTVRGRRREGAPELADTGLDAAAADGKPVRAVGQFRGANLCRDLPEPSRRDPRDWILMTSEGAVWVTGRRPDGRGFQLDPAYRGDVGRWLEVTGRVTVSGDVRYLEAGKVALIARPPESETVPCTR